MGKKMRVANEPQKPPSAYALFFKETQASVKEQKPAASFEEVSKIVRSMWTSLNAESKNLYKKKKELAKKEYLQDFNKYKASLAASEFEKSAVRTQDVSDEFHIEEPEETAAGSNSFTEQSSTVIATTGSMKQVNTEAIKENGQGTGNALVKPGIPVTAPNSDTITNGEPVVNGVGEVAAANDGLFTSVYWARFYSTSIGDPSRDTDDPVTPVFHTCIRAGCNNPGVHNPEWEGEYCSTDCVVSHCKDAFNTWVAGNMANMSVEADKSF